MKNLSAIENPHFIPGVLRCLAISLVVLVVASCATPPPPAPTPTPREIPSRPAQGRDVFTTTPAEGQPSVTISPIPAEPPREDPAKQLIDSGRYLDAALVLAELAKTMQPPHRQDYQLRVISLLLQGNYIEQADQILNETDTRNLATSMQVRKTLLGAQVALAKQAPDQAASILDSMVPMIGSAEPAQQKSFFLLQIDVSTTLNHPLNEARARVALSNLLSDSEEIRENQETLLRDLQALPAADLASARNAETNETLKGWLALAYIAKTSADEQQAQDAIAQWRSEFSGHAASAAIIEAILAKQPEALGRPTKIALILPFAGRFAKAGESIRNGFLTAYYAEQTNEHRPIISFYDEGNDPTQIGAIYDQAVSEGANFIVGPLSKDAVTELARYRELKQSVLTLNYGDRADATPGNFFQMSLSPEQEALHVAEHAWLDGHTNAAAIFPNTSWGQRIYDAFKQRWEELGGTIVEYQTYDIKNNDYAAPIKQLLNIDESEARQNRLRNLIREKFNYEPRRRKDVDFIFMAAFARQGRLLRPQLRFHQAADVPVYATSHVFEGTLNPDMDRDMNGVKFSDMPWTLLSDSDGSAMKSQIERAWPTSANRYMRLYALGVDAYQVIPQLNRLRRNRFASYKGQTGILYLDIDNRLQRRLLWAQFDHGSPKILSEF